MRVKKFWRVGQVAEFLGVHDALCTTGLRRGRFLRFVSGVPYFLTLRRSATWAKPIEMARARRLR